ncbi:MAG: SOS response-associated peptidase [Nocardioides sp.]
MCGRYASSRPIGDLIEEFDVVESRVDVVLEPDYNVAPTKDVYAVLERAPRDADGNTDRSAPPRRQLHVCQWGLIPSWATDPKIGNRMINARKETVAEKPAYRRAFAARRCLLPADGYFEWYLPTGAGARPGSPADGPAAPDAAQESLAGVRTRGVRPGGSRRPKKQPFFIRPHAGGLLAMAGVYEIWRDPTRTEPDPDRFRWTVSIITTDAEDGLGMIHDRMPMMVEPERWGSWLDPRISRPEELLDLLTPAAPGRLEAFPVAPLVSNVHNNGPQLVEPLPIDSMTREWRTDQRSDLGDVEGLF